MKYGAALSEDLGTDAQTSDSDNLFQPNRWLQATPLFSGKEYGTELGQLAREPTDWLAFNLLEDGEGRGSGREMQDIDFNIITRR